MTVRTPTASLKNDIKLGIYKKWDTYWTSSQGCKHTKHFYGGPDPSKAKFVYKLARLELGRFIRLITGHNNLNNFQTRIGLWNDDRCRFCGTCEETFYHLVTDCPRLWQSRRDIIGDLKPDNDMKWSVRDMIDFTYIPRVNEAFEGSWAHGDPVHLGDMASYDEDSDDSTSQDF